MKKRVPILFLIFFLPSIAFGERQKAPTHEIKKLFEINSSQAAVLDQPTDLVVSSTGTIYIVDGVNNKISAYDERGQFLFSFGKTGSGPGEFNAPVGIGIASNNDLFIADRGNRRVQFFDSKGTFKGLIDLSKHGVVPIDVAFDSVNRLCFITDNKKHRIVVFNTAGQFVREWGERGEQDYDFRYPATIWLRNEYLYIADVLNSRVSVYTKMGNFIRKVGQWGVLPGQFFRPKGVAVDDAGNVYISDSYIDIIEVFNANGKFLYVLGDGRGNIQRFTSPGGIFIKGNKLFVTEMLENRVSVFQVR